MCSCSRKKRRQQLTCSGMARHLFLKCISRSALSSAVSSSLCVSCALISFILFLLNKREKRSLFFFYFINQVDVFNPSRWNGDRKTCLHYFTCYFCFCLQTLCFILAQMAKKATKELDNSRFSTIVKRRVAVLNHWPFNAFFKSVVTFFLQSKKSKSQNIETFLCILLTGPSSSCLV